MSDDRVHISQCIDAASAAALKSHNNLITSSCISARLTRVELCRDSATLLGAERQGL